MRFRRLILWLFFCFVIGCGNESTTMDVDSDFQFVSSGAKLAKDTSGILPLSPPKRDWTVYSGGGYDDGADSNDDFPSVRGYAAGNQLRQSSVFLDFLIGRDLPNEGRCNESVALRRGSGRPQTSTPSLIEFSKLEVDGPLKVYGEYSPTPEVMIYADDNLIELIGAEARDGILSISAPSDSICYGIQPAVYFRGPQFRSVSVTGSASVELFGLFSRQLRINVGAGSRLLAVGHVNFGSVALDNYASAELSGLQMDSAQVQLSAHSTAHLRVTKSVVGSVEQYGALNLEENVRSEEITGAGSVDYFSVSRADASDRGHGPSLN